MGFTYNGSTPTAVTYNGNTVNTITYNGTTVWTAETVYSGTYNGTQMNHLGFSCKPYGVARIILTNYWNDANEYYPHIYLGGKEVAYYMYGTYLGLVIKNFAGEQIYGYFISDRSGIFLKWTPTTCKAGWMMFEAGNPASDSADEVSPKYGYGYDLGSWTSGNAPNLALHCTNRHADFKVTIKIRTADTPIETL